MSPSYEEVEKRAYDAWEERGRPLGSPDIDWFKAEQDLRGDKNENILSKVAGKVGAALGSAKALLSDLDPLKHNDD